MNKEEILGIIDDIEEIANNYGYNKMQIAFYLYMNYDGISIQTMTEEKINKIDTILEVFDGNFFNEQFNKLVENIKE